MIREPARDDELRRLIDSYEGELRALVELHDAEVKAARGAMRLQCELLEADLSDPSSDRERESVHRIDAAATVERFEVARVALERSRATLHHLRQGDAPGAAERVTALERELEERRAAEADLRSVVAAQRDDLAMARAEIARLSAPVALARAG